MVIDRRWIPTFGLAFAVLGCQKDPGARTDPDPSAAQPAEVESGAPTPASQPESPADPEQQALDEANAAATALFTTLKGRLTESMKAGGPTSALEVCTEVGQSLTAATGQAHGASVGRSSLRLRNPKNSGPEWVQQWLEATGEGKVAKAEGFARVVETDAGKVARVLRPIGVEKPCLHCHGPADSLAPEIRAGLEKYYPEDQATGYAEGDLRGALWAQAPVEG